MKKYVSFDSSVEVNGATVLGFIQCVNRDNILPFLRARGLEHIEPDQWYPLQDYLDVLNDMADRAGGGAMMDFVSIGMKIAETSPFPPEFDELPFADVLVASNTAYQMAHRNGDVGYTHAEKVAAGHVRLTMRMPYPSDLSYGVNWGMCRRYLPAGTQFTVTYDEDLPRFEEGGDETVIHIRWEIGAH